MRAELLFGSIAVCLLFGISAVMFPDGMAALLVVVFMSIIALFAFRAFADDKGFVTKVFLIALALRLGFGLLLHFLDLRGFFGGDASTYDYRGYILLESWTGGGTQIDPVFLNQTKSSPGWGLYYLVAILYSIVGRNILAAQSLCAVVGAATAPMVYFCANKVYANRRVAQTAAIVVAVFPAFIIWSGQLLKDGLIVFLLALAITMLLRLQEKLDPIAVALLFLALGGIAALRFYIFYMVAVAVAGSFVVGVSSTRGSLIRRLGALVVLGFALTYFGVTRNVNQATERFGDFERLQNSRLDLQQSAESGYGEDVDVSSTAGAISALPIGFAYLMFAPFPWEVTSLRAMIAVPEVLLWWGMMPLLAAGIVWTIKNRLRAALPMLIFSLMLTLAYSIFLGNVGTAYRQRTQIQVFLFIFIAVGWQLRKEKIEDRRLIRRARQRKLDSGGADTGLRTI